MLWFILPNDLLFVVHSIFKISPPIILNSKRVVYLVILKKSPKEINFIWIYLKKSQSLNTGTNNALLIN